MKIEYFKNLLFVVLLIVISNVLAANSLMALSFFWGVFAIIFVAVILQTALLSDKNRYPVRDDSLYHFANDQAVHIPIKLTKNGFYWPDGLVGADTILLRCRVKSRLLGWLRDPKITIKLDTLCQQHVLERRVKGIRFFNLSGLNQSQPGQFITFMPKHICWEIGEATLIGFYNKIDERQKLLVIAPHPDDAEIAAYGLYSQHSSVIVTITAGDQSYRHYQHVIADPKKARKWCGELRALDSVTVPYWAGITPEQHCVNLGYPDGMLAKLATEPQLQLDNSERDMMLAWRRYNTATWLGKKPDVIQWKSLVDELAHIIQQIKPTAIVCPHPIIDKHRDHRYATRAVMQALQKTDNQSVFYCYQNHLTTSRIAPFGPAHSEISLPPLAAPLLHYGKVYAHPLTQDQQYRKVFSLEMMRDLRKRPMPAYRKWRDYRYNLANMLNGRGFNCYGDDTFYRRAIRPHELFFCYSMKELAELVANISTII